MILKELETNEHVLRFSAASDAQICVIVFWSGPSVFHRKPSQRLLVEKIIFVKNSFEKHLKMNFFQLITSSEVFRRVEFLYQSEVRLSLAALNQKLYS